MYLYCDKLFFGVVSMYWFLCGIVFNVCMGCVFIDWIGLGIRWWFVMCLDYGGYFDWDGVDYEFYGDKFWLCFMYKVFFVL